MMTIILVDPRGLYGPTFFPQLSDDTRTLKLNYYNTLEMDPELVILGSSRAQGISPAYG